MPKKKRDRVDVEDIVARPWCYYCDRDFDDQKVLIEHQRAKHFSCPSPVCHRRLNTAGGLLVHMAQVHKETLSFVENALESRKGVEPEVFGMMGIPEELVEARRQRILNEFFKEEAEHRARTGNPPPGQKQGEPNSKKRKMETVEELKARAAEFRAKRAAEKQAAKEGKSVAQSASKAPDTAQGHAALVPNPALPPNPPPNPPSNLQPSYDQMQSYGPQFHGPHHGLHMQSPLSAGLPSPFPITQPGQWPAFSSPASFSPPQATPYPTPPFMYPGQSPMTGQMPGSMMPNHNIRYAPNAPTDRQTVTVAQTPLQPAPGLPSRPSFDLPNINRDDMHRMHTGQVPPINKTAYQPHNAVTPERAKSVTYAMGSEVALLHKIKNELFDKVPAKPIAKKAIKQEEIESEFGLLPPSSDGPEYQRYMAEEPQMLLRRITSTGDIDTVFEQAGRPFITPEDMNDCLHDVKVDLKQIRAAEALAKPLPPLKSGFQPDDLDEVAAVIKRIWWGYHHDYAQEHVAADENDKAAKKARKAAAKKAKSKPDLTKMMYSDNRETPEEKMAKQSKYAYAFGPKSPALVEGEVGGAVTGVSQQ